MPSLNWARGKRGTACPLERCVNFSKNGKMGIKKRMKSG
jgi:hypothetical protein